MNVNQVILVGRLTRDPEVRELENDNALAKFGLAVSRKFGSGQNAKEETAFVDCVAWGNTAKVISRFVHKGDLLGVTGRLQLDSWDDKETGQKRSRLIVVAENVSLGPKSANGKSEEDAGEGFNYGAKKEKGSAAKPASKFVKKPAPQVEDTGEPEEEEAVPARAPAKRPF